MNADRSSVAVTVNAPPDAAPSALIVAPPESSRAGTRASPSASARGQAFSRRWLGHTTGVPDGDAPEHPATSHKANSATIVRWSASAFTCPGHRTHSILKPRNTLPGFKNFSVFSVFFFSCFSVAVFLWAVFFRGSAARWAVIAAGPLNRSLTLGPAYGSVNVIRAIRP